LHAVVVVRAGVIVLDEEMKSMKEARSMWWSRMMAEDVLLEDVTGGSGSHNFLARHYLYRFDPGYNHQGNCHRHLRFRPDPSLSDRRSHPPGSYHRYWKLPSPSESYSQFIHGSNTFITTISANGMHWERVPGKGRRLPGRFPGDLPSPVLRCCHYRGTIKLHDVTPAGSGIVIHPHIYGTLNGNSNTAG